MDPGQIVTVEALAAAERDDVVAVVFVEGASDRAALVTLATKQGRDLDAEGVAVVPMDGFSGIGRFLRDYGPAGRDLRLAGLCDEAEAWYVGQKLAAAGVDDAAFPVCHPDLEGELIRAHGPDGAEAVLDTMGDLVSFRRFQRQPFHRDGAVEDQLHRFLGTRATRKLRAAEAFVAALPLDRMPAPLTNALEAVR